MTTSPARTGLSDVTDEYNRLQAVLRRVFGPKLGPRSGKSGRTYSEGVPGSSPGVGSLKALGVRGLAGFCDQLDQLRGAPAGLTSQLESA
jgi:hypothetical protein